MSDARRLDPVPAAVGGEGPLERAALALRRGRALDVVLFSGRDGELPTPESLERARRALLEGAGGSCEPALLSLGGSPPTAALLHAHGGPSDLRSAARGAAAAAGLCAGAASSSAAPGATIAVLAAVAAEGLAIARQAGTGEAVHSELYDLVGRSSAGSEVTAVSPDRSWIPRSPIPRTPRTGQELTRTPTGREEATLETLREELAILETERRQLRRRDTQVRTLLERDIATVLRRIEERESEADRQRRVMKGEAV